MDKLKQYIKELVKDKVDVGNDIFSERFEHIDNKENISLFIDLINEVYKGEKIAIFPTPFLENIEQFLIRPENIDLIEKMFQTIDEKLDGYYYNIVSSGTFGLYIYKLVNEGLIDFDGNVVIVSGRIRKSEPEDGIKILEKRYDIDDSSFVFLDDSYVYGGTRDRIDSFLEKYDAQIMRTFAFYTHYQEDPLEVYSEFCYSTDVEERIVPIHKQIDFINKVNFKLYENEIRDEIEKGNIKDVRELAKTAKRISDNDNIKVIKRHISKFKNYR